MSSKPIVITIEFKPLENSFIFMASECGTFSEDGVQKGAWYVDPHGGIEIKVGAVSYYISGPEIVKIFLTAWEAQHGEDCLHGNAT